MFTCVLAVDPWLFREHLTLQPNWHGVCIVWPQKSLNYAFHYKDAGTWRRTMAHKKWTIGNQAKRLLSTADFPALMIYFLRSLWLHHFFAALQGSALLLPSPPLFLITVTHCRFCLSRPALFFVPLSRILFWHLAANNSLQFPSLLVDPATANAGRGTAEPPHAD